MEASAVRVAAILIVLVLLPLGALANPLATEAPAKLDPCGLAVPLPVCARAHLQNLTLAPGPRAPGEPWVLRPLGTHVTPRAAAQAQDAAPIDDCGSGADAGDGRESPALNVTLPLACAATYTDYDDYDAYAFDVPAESVVDVRVDSSIGSLVALEKVGGGFVAFDLDALAAHVSAGRYVLVVTAWDWIDNATAYNLSIATSAWANTDDCGAGDVPDVFSLSDAYSFGRVLPANGACNARADHGDGDDAYLLAVDGAHDVDARFTFPAEDARNLTVLVSDGVRFIGFDDPDANGLVDVPLVDTGHAATWAFIVLWSGSVQRGPGVAYHVETRAVDPAPADDCGTATELPFTFHPSAAPRLDVAQTCAGALAPGDTGDSINIENPNVSSVLVVNATTADDAGVLVGHLDAGVGTVATSAQPGRLHVSGHERQGFATAFSPLDTNARPYAYSYHYEPDTQNDCGFGHDAPHELAWVDNITASRSCAGYYDDADWFDVYRVAPQPGDFYRLDLTPAANTTNYAQVYDEAKQQWIAVLSTSPFAGDPTIRGVADGPLDLRLFAYGPAYPVWYFFNVSIVPATSMNDCGAGFDANAGVGHEARLVAGAPCHAELTTSIDASDDYALHVENGSEVVVNVTFDDLARGEQLPQESLDGAQLRVEYPDGTLHFPEGASASGVATWAWAPPLAGDYHLVLSAPNADDGRHGYGIGAVVLGDGALPAAPATQDDAEAALARRAQVETLGLDAHGRAAPDDAQGAVGLARRRVDFELPTFFPEVHAFSDATLDATGAGVRTSGGQAWDAASPALTGAIPIVDGAYRWIEPIAASAGPFAQGLLP